MSNLLITGGTGTLGHMIVDCILSNTYPGATSYGKIIIYSRDEQKQEQMAARFALKDKDKKLRFFIGDVRDKDRLRMAMYDVNTVIHAAALKVVPTIEYNPIEAIKTNINGTQNVIETVIDLDRGRNLGFGRTMILVSTDKAVKPINLYGATKLAAEKLTLAANNLRGGTGPRFGVVRYGNVTGSRGSVVPKFIEKIENNYGTVQITDPQSTRFWITPYDAAQFVLNAVNQINHGIGDKRLFVPLMPAYSIVDLAKALGAKKLEVVGLRPGEKIHEDILTEREIEEHYWLAKLPTSSNLAKRMTVKELRKALNTNKGII